MLKLVYTFRFVNHNFNYIFKFSRVPQFVTGRFKRKHTVDCVHGRIKAWEIFNNISTAFYFLLLLYILSYWKVKNKIDTQKSFDEMDSLLRELENMIENTKAELIFINSKGEALINDKIDVIIDLIKVKGLPVRLLSNGYLLGRDEYIKIANKCDEVIGEIKVITEEHFQKIQRPIEGYTLLEYISNIVSFNKQYKGRFIFEITIIKGYNDDEKSIEKIKILLKKYLLTR